MAAQEINSTTLKNDANLQGYWRFESNSNDSGPNGYNLTNVNAPTYVAGQFGNAIHLVSGSSQFADIASASCPNLGGFTGSFTLYTWINMITGSRFNNIVTKRSNANLGYSFNANSDNTLQFTVTSGNAAQLTTVITPAISTATWYQAVAVYDGTAKKNTIYINGSGTTGSANASMSTIDNPNVPFAVGAAFQGGGDVSGNYFDGNIDDVAVFNRVLSAPDISALYNGTYGKTSGAAFFFNMI